MSPMLLGDDARASRYGKSQWRRGFYAGWWCAILLAILVVTVWHG